MLTYIVYYAFSSSLLCLSFAKSRLVSRLLFFLFFLTLALFSGLRGTVGQDTYNYQLLYEIFGRDGFLSILSSLSSEPLFVFLSVLHYSIFESFFLFALFISFLQVILLAYATKGLYYRRMFLLIYCLIFLLEYHMNAIRVGLAISFFLCYLSDRGKKRRIYFLVASLLTHYSLLILAPVVFFREVDNAKISPKKILAYLLFSFLSFLVVYLSIGNYITHKIDAYDLFTLKFSGISTVASLFLIMGMSLLLVERELQKDCFVIVLLFSFFYFLSPFHEIVYRFVKVLIPVLLFLAMDKKIISLENMKAKPRLFYVAILSLWFSLDAWRFAINESQIRAESGRGSQTYLYIPYEIYDFNKLN